MAEPDVERIEDLPTSIADGDDDDVDQVLNLRGSVTLSRRQSMQSSSSLSVLTAPADASASAAAAAAAQDEAQWESADHVVLLAGLPARLAAMQRVDAQLFSLYPAGPSPLVPSLPASSGPASSLPAPDTSSARPAAAASSAAIPAALPVVDPSLLADLTRFSRAAAADSDASLVQLYRNVRQLVAHRDQLSAALTAATTQRDAARADRDEARAELGHARAQGRAAAATAAAATAEADMLRERVSELERAFAGEHRRLAL
jgi:hypothetical protein